MISYPFVFSLMWDFNRSSNVRIPLEETHYTLLLFAGTSVHTGQTVRMVLSDIDVHSANTLRVPASSDGVGSFNIELRDSHRFLSDGGPAYIDVYRDLLPAVGPVTLHRFGNDYEMLLNSTDENFASFCEPESIISVHGVLGRVFDMSITSGTQREISFHAPYKVGYQSGHFGSVPELIHAAIVEALVARGAIRRQRGYLGFRNCGVEQISDLPTIEYQFANGAKLIITPEDYLVFRSEERTCHLQVAPCSSETTSPCVFHPLAIPNLHVRLLPQNTLQLCDSI